MHAAPSVTYPVGRSAFLAFLYALAGVCVLAMAALWSAQGGVGWRQALAFASAGLCAVLALWNWLRTPSGAVRWDGAHWTWEGGGAPEPGQPQVALDLQSRLVLHWRGEQGRTRWLCLDAMSAPAHWEALRRAVYSRASTPVAPAGEPPAAEQ